VQCAQRITTDTYLSANLVTWTVSLSQQISITIKAQRLPRYISVILYKELDNSNIFRAEHDVQSTYVAEHRVRKPDSREWEKATNEMSTLVEEGVKSSLDECPRVPLQGSTENETLNACMQQYI
jgi:hypothetical protein